jgi:tricorn protease
VYGGDVERPATVSVGLLGCDFTFDEAAGLYRIGTIYAGAPWDANARSPLRRPGISVTEGDYLLAVNGRRLDPSQDPWAAFQGLSGEVVTLTLSATASREEARDVIVKPVGSERRLRYLAWVEANRARVEAATGGRVGYIHVPNTATSGQNELVRQFIPQQLKDGLIVDERFNGGGFVPDRFIELLNRPILNFWARRDRRGDHSPYVAHRGPKVMLINQWSGSGGDAFPFYFRKAGLGPLIGRRTWGGLIGYSGNPKPIDGGQLTAPNVGFWHVEGRWGIEGYGVDPDYDVENPPHELAAGRDAQLEKAISVILERLEKQPPVRPERPPYPDRSR